MQKWYALLGIWMAGNAAFAQVEKWQSGVLKQEFLFEQASFPESHAATIAETPAGLVTAWFGGTKERNPDVCIWVSRLEKERWTAPARVADGIVNDTLRYACWNPVLYQIPGGDLMLFYKTGPSPSTWKGWLKSSADGGKTWSAARALPEGYIGPVKNKPVLLANGNLICPTSTEGKGWKLFLEITPDFGKTWRKVAIPDGGLNAIQPSVLFHGRRRLQLLARSKDRALVESWSDDDGETWTPLTKSTLPNNNSGTDAVTLRDGRQLLVYNHVLPPGTLAKGPRTPLHVSVSKDGKQWEAAAILEDSPVSQYSYPSVIQTKDGLVHVVYTWRRQKIRHAVIDPKALKPQTIRDGQWPALPGYQPPVAGTTN